MNWDWAKEQLKAGKKVRRPLFSPSVWLWMKSDELMMNNEMMDTVYASWELADDWEEFVESPTTMGFVEAMQAAVDGKTVRRLSWDKDMHSLSRENGVSVDCGIDATDWVVV